MKKILSVLLVIAFLAGTLSFAADAKEITTGNMTNVVVFVRFRDDASADEFGPNTEDILKTFNDTSGSYYDTSLDVSFKAYISEISRGMLNVVNVFPQLSSGTINTLTLSAARASSNDSTVLQEVINAFNDGRLSLPSGKVYDNRTDGIIDNLTVIIHGRSSSGSDFMWPHKSICPVTDRINSRYYVGNYNMMDGWSLLEGNQQGTLSHEFLHSVGLPDLYRYSGGGHPVGLWDIMASNSSFQQYPLSYQRYEMGWVPMQTVTGSGDYTLDAVTNKTSDTVLYKIETPMSNTEFIMLEYRLKQSNILCGGQGFETKIPSSGLLAYRVNTAVEYKSNSTGEDYIYVYRPGETGLNDAGAQVFDGAIDPDAGETGYGSADFDAPFSDDTLFYSDGRNSGIVISNVTYSSDKSQISFHIEYPDYSALDLWDNVGASPADTVNYTQCIADDSGRLYALYTGEENYVRIAKVLTFDGSVWTAAAPSVSRASDPYIEVCGGKLYITYVNSSGKPVLAVCENGAWRTLYTGTDSYPSSLQLFRDGNTLYMAWVKDGTSLIIKKLSGSSLVSVNSSLTAQYFSNPALTACDNFIYVVYSDFFAGTSTTVKRYDMDYGFWENVYVPDPLPRSNVHRAIQKDGELWFFAAASGFDPIVVSIKGSGEIIQKTVPTDVKNFLYLGIDVSSSVLCVGLFGSQNNSQILYLENGTWKSLGSSPCESIQAADMCVYDGTVYVASAAQGTGALIVRSKQLPQGNTARLIATPDSGVVIRDNLVIGLPLNFITPSLFLDATDGGYYCMYDNVCGTQIYLYSSDDVLVKIYTVIICGDVNRDRVIDGCDAVLISCIINGLDISDTAGTAAADYDKDGTVDENDFRAVSDLGIFC